MADNVIDDQYFTYDARLASFNKTTKKRASGAGGRGTKALNWPHKRILPANLASAGFFFSPTPEHPDNVLCFLCHKGLDGWEEGDDPLREHLNHTSGCGWATLAAIEAEIDDYHLGDPSAPDMVAARKATFAGRWPHEGKRGWKCKTKQLVDSGWKYTPTPESDDMATCAYCQLALDGWEPADKPMDEHYKRAPNCPFFTLPSQTHGKKATRGKASRTSKASRLSGQSALTAPSEIGSVDELTIALDDDTVLTTTSTMTAGGKKPRAKKATTAKGKKTRAKKEETMEPEEAPVVVDDEPTPQKSPPKAKRGKKRGSDAIEESTLTVADAPAPKKRATRGRASKAVESSVVEPVDAQVEEPQEEQKKPAARKRGRPSKAQTGRKASTASRASSVSVASANVDTVDLVNDDEEIERQLQADLERPLTDDEDIMADSDSERFKAKAKNRKTSSAAKSVDFDMFDPQPAQADDAAVQEELKQLEAEMQVDEPEQLEVPKKGRKAGTRKASKQTKPKKTKAAPVMKPEPVPEPEFEEIPLEAEPVETQQDEQQDDSLGSTDTVIRKTVPATAKRGPGRPSKLSIASVMSEDELDNVQLVEPIEEEVEEVKSVDPQPAVKRPRGRPSKASLASRTSSTGEASEISASQAPAPAKKGRGRPKKAEQQQGEEAAVPKAAQKAQQRKASSTKKAPEPEPAPVEVVEEFVEDQIFEEPSSPILERQLAPATPPRAIVRAKATQKTPVSPSPSPQSSDAENQPPSSRPSTQTTRIALAPIAETPKALSPSKRNIIAGLQSTTPWSAVDIDAMLGTPRRGGGANKENGAERLIKKGKDLTSPEKEMTVEEWVYYNAGQAEKMLKQECEAMVSRFESEGARAMNVLEGLVVD